MTDHPKSSSLSKAEEIQQPPASADLGVTPEVAAKLLNVREALVHDDVPEAWNWLYKIADSDISSLTPWAKLEALASTSGVFNSPDRGKSNVPETESSESSAVPESQRRTPESSDHVHCWHEREDAPSFCCDCEDLKDVVHAVVPSADASEGSQIDRALASIQDENLEDKNSV